jgi:drug/metabolite transporter (DMT)-like permease
MFPAFLTTILFSISAVCAQRTSRTLGGVEANFWRLLLATLLLGLWAHLAGQGISGKAFPLFLLSGVLGFGIGDVALYQALPKLGSRLSILLVHCLAAPFAAATEWLWLGTRMSGMQIVAGTLILSGVALALAPGRHLQISRRDFWLGVTFGVIAALGQGMGAVLSRHAYYVAAQAGEHVDGLTAAYQRILAGIVVATGFFLVVKLRGERGEAGGDSPETSARRPRFLPPTALWPWIVANGLTGPALGVGCYQWALSQRGTGIVLPIVALTPLVIIPFSRYVEGERPRKRSLAGGVVAVAGVFILAGGVEVVKKFISPGVGFP